MSCSQGFVLINEIMVIHISFNLRLAMEYIRNLVGH